MKTTLENVYQCDYCKKKMRSKGAMVRHEKFCKENPNNKHICFEWCKYLQKERVNEYSGYDENGMKEIESSKVEFTCLARNEKMYSYLLEKRLVFKPEFTKGLVRMPLDCDKYEVMKTTEYGQYYNENE